MLKKSAAFIAGVIVLNFMTASVSALYSDTKDHWAAQFVELLSDKGIICGDDNEFRPDDAVMADEFIKMTITAMGIQVTPVGGYWAAPYIEKAKQLEIVYDDEFTTFNRPISRGEIAKIAVRALELDKVNEADKAKLIKNISDYYDILNEYKEYVLAAYKNGIMNGYGDKSFKSNRNMTRAEACVTITRMLKLKPLENGQDIPDQFDVKNAYYIATTGKDTNDGSKNAPFATVEKARDTVRELIKNNQYPDEGITVYLREGTYEVQKTIEFNELDSGTPEKPVTYTSYPGETAKITGSKALPYNKFTAISADAGAKLLDKSAASKVLQIDLKSVGITDYGELSRRGFLIAAGVIPQMELYIDGSRQQLARWPNTDWVGTTEIIRSGARSQSGVLQGAEFKIDYDRPTKWKTNITDIYTAGVLGENYFYGYYPIGKIEPGKITLREGAVKSYYSKHFIRYENVFEELDTEGEYYVDRANGILYLYPPQGFGANTDIRVSQSVENIITGSNVKNMVIENLKLDMSRAGGIRVVGAENLIVRNCEISGMGTAGVVINSAWNCKILNSVIHDIGATGISIAGGDYGNLIPSNNLVSNNHIYKAAQLERSYQTGITVGYKAVGTTVSHNEIHDMPHAAIIIYGPENIIEYNNIYDCVKEFHDMDAIYLNVYQYPWERGVYIRNNYIHDFGREQFTEKQINVAGIRTDNQGNGLNVIGNVFANIGYQNANQVRSVCAEGIENVIKNNIFVDVSETYDGPDTFSADAKWDIESATIAPVYKEWQTYLPVYGAKYPEVADFFKHHFQAYPKSNVFRDNLVVNIKYPLSTLNAIPSAEGFRANEQLVNSGNNYVTKTDPGFADYSGGNFMLRDDSEAYTKINGFQKVEFDKMGLLKDVAIGVVKQKG